MCSSSIQRQQHLIKTIVFCDRLGLASLCLLESAFCIARTVSKSQRSGGAENLRHTWKSMELTLLTRFPLCLATAPVGPWEFSVVRSLVPWQEHNVGCLACCWTCNLQPSNSNHGSQVNSRLGRGFFFGGLISSAICKRASCSQAIWFRTLPHHGHAASVLCVYENGSTHQFQVT